MKKNQLIALTLSLAMVLPLSACGGTSAASEKGTDGASAPGKTIDIKIGTVMSENAPGAQALLSLKDDLAEKSGGRINVMLYFGGQLGGELEMIEQARGGDIQMVTSNHMNISNTIKPLAALESYFLFDDYDHAFRFQDSEGGQAMLDAYNEMGLQGLGFFATGFRQFTNSKKPITKASDLKGIKIRGYSEVQIAAWQSVGVVLSSVAWNELFTSMQQHLVDGQECAISSIYEQKFYEVQKYVSLTSHLMSSDILVCNQQWLAGLDPADREMILQAVKDAAVFHRTNFVTLEEGYIEEFKKNDTEVNELDDAARQELSDIMNAAVNPAIIKLAGQENFDIVQKWAKETKQ